MAASQTIKMQRLIAYLAILSLDAEDAVRSLQAESEDLFKLLGAPDESNLSFDKFQSICETIPIPEELTESELETLLDVKEMLQLLGGFFCNSRLRFDPEMTAFRWSQFDIQQWPRTWRTIRDRCCALREELLGRGFSENRDGTLELAFVGDLTNPDVY